MKTPNTERILLVDDDQTLLDGLRRAHRKVYDLDTACGGEEGLESLANGGPFAVVVSDYQMPGMNGATFLEQARQRHPDTVRVLLTGHADLNSAIDVVNKGHIFRFLSKPCASDVFRQCVDAALEQHRLRQAERVLLEQTVRGSLEVLSDVLALSNPGAFGRANRVRGHVRQMAAKLGLEHRWRFETAALLSQIGLIAVPPDIIDKMAAGESLSEEYERVVARHPQTARELLGKIPRLEGVADMIAHQRMRHFEAQRSTLAPDVQLGSQILALALDLDELLSLGASRDDALRVLGERTGHYDPRLIEVLRGIDPIGRRQQVPVAELRVGMVLEQDVLDTTGTRLVAKQTMITDSLLARLRNYADLRGVVEPIRVLIPGAAADGGELGRVA